MDIGINFTDQAVNQERARNGSQNGSLATLDLSSASDRVYRNYVMDMLPPLWLREIEPILATQGQYQDMVFDLNMFALMGSPLCFPIEAMYFYSIVRSVTDNVTVYGDDIIVPCHAYHHVCDALVDFGLKVNENKSFHRSLFRESCGSEYYANNDVSMVRFRGFDYESVLSFHNMIFDNYGIVLDTTLQYLQSKYGERLKYVHPELYTKGTDYVVVRDQLDPRKGIVWSAHLQCYVARAIVLVDWYDGFVKSDL